MICLYCESSNLQKRGYNPQGTKQRYQCNTCHRYFAGDLENTQCKLPAKVLLFDIETLPLEVYVWQLKNNDYISPSNIIKDWCVLSWSAKWLFNDKVEFGNLTPYEAIHRDDRRSLQRMWELLDEADICIGHNSVRFDHKKLNTRFLVGGMQRPMYYKTIDTLQVAKQNFAFSSNKLDYINAQLGIHQKSGTDYELWKQCAVGNEEAIKRMVNYNINDVQILEELYVKLRPWITNHPSLRSYISINGDICSNCGSDDLELGGWYRTNQNKYQAFRCNNCGSLGRRNKKS